MKICTKCKENKSLSEFTANGGHKDGLQSYCKDCNKRWNREVYNIRPEQRKRQAIKNKEYRENPKNRAKILRVAKLDGFTPKGKYRAYREGAKRRKIGFNITIEEFLTFWQEPCSYCGNNIKTIGIDRVDNSIGYIMGNIISCCGVCNWMKLASTHDEFIEQCENIHYYSKLRSLV